MGASGDEPGGSVAGLVAGYLASVPDHPVWRPVRAEDRDWLVDQPLPRSGRPLAELVADVRDRVLRYPMGNGHPRFFGWVNSPPSPAGVLVEPLAAALNPSCAGGEHAGPLLERAVVRWLAELVGYPHPPGGGLLTSGASMATVICLAAARQRATRRDGWDVRLDGLSGRAPLVLYVSAEGHSCLPKAAELLGLGSRNVRTIPVDAAFRMDPAALLAAVAEDRAAGLRPFCVAASAGTVNTGAVDPLTEIADVADAHDLWFHVDGAYGALGVLAAGAGHWYRGMERADSLALDPHKWLGVPVDCGCALFADPAPARDAFSLVPAYLRDEDAGELGWFSEYGPEQTRPFRALRAWATLSHLGRDGVVALVERTTALARALAGMVERATDLETLAPVVTSIVAFRYRPPGDLPADRLDELNRAIPAEVQRRGRAFLTGTRCGGLQCDPHRPSSNPVQSARRAPSASEARTVEALRACLLNAATTERDLEILLDEVRAAASASDARLRLTDPA